MRKVKTFSCKDYAYQLDNEINEFIGSKYAKRTLINVSLSVCSAGYSHFYSASVVYEEED